MMINKTFPSIDQNYWLKRLDTANLELTNQISIKVPNVFKPTHIIAWVKNFAYSSNLKFNIPSLPTNFICLVAALLMEIRNAYPCYH